MWNSVRRQWIAYSPVVHLGVHLQVLQGIRCYGGARFTVEEPRDTDIALRCEIVNRVQRQIVHA